MSKSIYRITLLNWKEHNSGHRKSYKKVMLSNNFIQDAKVKSMPMTHRWVFLNLIVICGEHASDTVELTQQQLNNIIETRLGANNVLQTLQQLQVLTYETSNLSLILKNELKNKGRPSENETTKKADHQQEIFSENENPKPPTASKPAAPKKKASLTWSFESPETFIDKIPDPLWDAWITSFNEAYILSQIRKAHTWLINNPKKNKKTQLGWQSFMTGWLERGWDEHTKKINTQQKTFNNQDFRP